MAGASFDILSEPDVAESTGEPTNQDPWPNPKAKHQPYTLTVNSNLEALPGSDALELSGYHDAYDGAERLAFLHAMRGQDDAAGLVACSHLKVRVQVGNGVRFGFRFGFGFAEGWVGGAVTLVAVATRYRA